MKNIIILSILVIISCSTPYQPKGSLGGYSSEKLGANSYIVEFKGNQHTKAETVFNYLERRCAEIAIENGFDYFIVYQDSSYINKTTFDNAPGVDDQLGYIGDRKDKHSLTEKTGMDYDPLQTLYDTKTRLRRTYTSYVGQDGSSYANTLIDLEASDVVGVYKILLVNEVIENFREYYFPAQEIIEQFND